MVLQYETSFISNELFISASLRGFLIELSFVGGNIIGWWFKTEDEAKYVFEYLMGIIELKENRKIIIDSVLNDYKNGVVY